MTDAQVSQISLPTTIPVAFLLFCSPSAHQLLSAETLRSWVRPWVRANVNTPLHDLVLPFLDLPLVQLQMTPKETFPPEFRAALTEWLDDGQRREVEQATHCLAVRSDDMPVFPRVGLWTCLAAALACAERLGGVIVDVDTKRVFPRNVPFSKFHNQGLPHIRHFLAVPHSLVGDGSAYMTTFGLARFGLPEMQIPDIPPLDLQHLTLVLCGVCQVLLSLAMRPERPQEPLQVLTLPLETVLTAPYLQIARGLPTGQPTTGSGTEARVRLEVRPGRHNSAHRFVTLLPPEGTMLPHDEWLRALVSTFFASGDPVFTVAGNEDAMARAHQRARAELPDIKRRFQAGLMGALPLCVKYGFSVPGGQEFMWVRVREWRGDQVSGPLTNEPLHRPDLRPGQTVTLPEGDIYDWMVLGPDGSLAEGAYTTLAAAGRPTAKAESGPADDTPDIAEIRRRFRRYLDDAYAQMERPRRGLFGVRRAAAPPDTEVRKRLYQVAEEGTPVFAYIVMANTALMRPGSDDAPCLALVAFAGAEPPRESIVILAKRLMGLKGTQPMEPDLRVAATFVNEEEYVPNRRRRVPPSLTDDFVVYAVDLHVRRSFLPGGFLQSPLLPCLATPGEQGLIEMVPPSVIGG